MVDVKNKKSNAISKSDETKDTQSLSNEDL